MKKLIVLMAFVVSMFTIPVFAGIASTKTFDVPNATHGHVSKRHSKKRYKKRSKKRRGYGVVAKINLSTQRMHVYQNGRHKYTWKISSGRSGYSTPQAAMVFTGCTNAISHGNITVRQCLTPCSFVADMLFMELAQLVVLDAGHPMVAFACTQVMRQSCSLWSAGMVVG